MNAPRNQHRPPLRLILVVLFVLSMSLIFGSFSFVFYGHTLLSQLYSQPQPFYLQVVSGYSVNRKIYVHP